MSAGDRQKKMAWPETPVKDFSLFDGWHHVLQGHRDWQQSSVAMREDKSTRYGARPDTENVSFQVTFLRQDMAKELSAMVPPAVLTLGKLMQ